MHHRFPPVADGSDARALLPLDEAARSLGRLSYSRRPFGDVGCRSDSTRSLSTRYLSATGRPAPISRAFSATGMPAPAPSFRGRYSSRRHAPRATAATTAASTIMLFTFMVFSPSSAGPQLLRTVIDPYRSAAMQQLPGRFRAVVGLQRWIRPEPASRRASRSRREGLPTRICDAPATRRAQRRESLALVWIVGPRSE